MIKSKIRRDLESLTNDILIKNDMLKIPVDLLQIAHNNNIEVYYQQLPKDVSGAIKYNKRENRFQILLQKSDAVVRQRFTLAHELGHYFLHQELLKDDEIHVDILYRINNAQEKEVDYFAGALLMNEELLKRLFQLDSSISTLSKIFEVSESAMTVRLMILGLI